MGHILGFAKVFFFFLSSYWSSSLIYFFKLYFRGEIIFSLLPDFTLEELRFIVEAKFFEKSLSFIVTL
jgi:hypothetical protein